MGRKRERQKMCIVERKYDYIIYINSVSFLSALFLGGRRFLCYLNVTHNPNKHKIHKGYNFLQMILKQQGIYLENKNKLEFLLFSTQKYWPEQSSQIRCRCPVSSINNNNLSSMHRQKCLPGSFGIQVRDHETPMLFKIKESNFEKAGLHPGGLSIMSQLYIQ